MVSRGINYRIIGISTRYNLSCASLASLLFQKIHATMNRLLGYCRLVLHGILRTCYYISQEKLFYMYKAANTRLRFV